MTTLLPMVDERRCIGAGDCVAVCPTECLELRHGVPALVRPRDCISCEICQAVCPTDAIHMEEHWVA
jgi:NAD-dependent dihydropyrimidine dehydrogenase PreA subunit